MAVFMNNNDPNQWPHVFHRGITADLQPLRTAPDVFWKQRHEILDSYQGLIDMPVQLQWNDNHNTNDSSSSPRWIAGHVYVTTCQLLLVVNTTDETTTSPSRFDHQPQDSNHTTNDGDAVIGATCITLHALMDDPPPSCLYLQVTPPEEEENMVELTLRPILPADNNDGNAACQTLFDALCRLVSAHPLELENDDGEPGNGYGGDENMMMMMTDDDLTWVPTSSSSAGLVGHKEATNDERTTMLHKLDAMLVVRPELELSPEEGQFDDADEME